MRKSPSLHALYIYLWGAQPILKGVGRLYVEAVVQTLLYVGGLYLVFSAAGCLTLRILYPARRLYAPTLCAELVGASLVWLAVCLLPARWLWATALVRVAWSVPLFGIYSLTRRAPWRVHAGAACAVGVMTAAVAAMLYGVVSLL